MVKKEGEVMDFIGLTELNNQCDRIKARWLLKRNDDGPYQLMVFSRDKEGQLSGQFYAKANKDLSSLINDAIRVLKTI